MAMQVLENQRRRSPCGERGLKLHPYGGDDRPGRSLPVRGAWIEIGVYGSQPVLLQVAPRAGSVD